MKDYSNNKYYKGMTPAIKKYQKSGKYKKYRREYETIYRTLNKERVRYNTWKSVMKPTLKQKEAYLRQRGLWCSKTCDFKLNGEF